MSSNRGMDNCRCCDIQILANTLSRLCGRCFWALRIQPNTPDVRCSYHGNTVTTARDDNVIKR